MKTLNYFAVLTAAILISLSFNTISSGSQQLSDCTYCDAKCMESGCCDDLKNSSQGSSASCCNECTNDKCKETCSAEMSSEMNGASINKEQSSIESTKLTCPDMNNSGGTSKNCCK